MKTDAVIEKISSESRMVQRRKINLCSYYTYGWTHNNNKSATIYFNNKGKINEKYYMNWGKGYLK